MRWLRWQMRRLKRWHKAYTADDGNADKLGCLIALLTAVPAGFALGALIARWAG